MCEDNLRLKKSAWLVEKNYVMTFCDYIWARFLNNYWKKWRHCETTTERGFWLVSEKKWRHSEFTSERGFWKNTEKIEDILRLQRCEVYHWLVKKNVWKHSEATNKQKISLVIKKKYCDDILRLHLSEVFE